VLEEAELGTANLCLLDTDTEGLLGGTGQVFDWSVAAEVAREMPVMLAGGLTPLNVVEAVLTVRPWAVDVSSGVEIDGAKDERLIREFVDTVHAAETATG
jgi:phosphoribosylanthranilate isomerase